MSKGSAEMVFILVGYLARNRVRCLYSNKRPQGIFRDVVEAYERFINFW